MIKRRYSNKRKGLVNRFDWGSESKAAFGNAFKTENLAGSLGSIGGGVTSIIQAGMDNAKLEDTTNIENQIESANNFEVKASNNDSLLNMWMNGPFVDNVEAKDLRKSAGEMITNTLGATVSGASSGATVGGGIGAIVGGAAGLLSGIGSSIAGAVNAKKKAKELNSQIDEANNQIRQAYYNEANRIEDLNDINAMTNLLAEGGGIHISPSKRGTFTAAAKRHGKSVQAFASQVLANKDNYSSAMVKKANFARNASKWKHADGGVLAHGLDINNGITTINNGGTHEENPFEGIQIGVDNQGIPNLVEEGEVIWNDYVFSNRLKVPKQMKSKYKLRGQTFADIAKNAQKESEERPNDPISKRGLEDIMSKLAMEQEMLRDNKLDKKYAKGGRLYSGLEDNPSQLLALSRQRYANNVLPPLSSYPNYDSIPDNWYTTDYLNFVNSLSENDVVSKSLLKGLNEGKYGDIGNNTLTLGQLKRLALDNKKGPVHNAVSQAYRNSIKLDKLSPKSYTGDNPPIKTKAIETPPISDLTSILSTDISKGIVDDEPNNNYASWLRYAPAIGSGIAAISDLFRDTDYGNADLIRQAADNLSTVKFTPINDYLTYRPLDRNYGINILNAQANSTRRAIENQANGNRGAAMAGILAADYNAQTQLGNLYRAAEEYNQAQKERVATFNRGTHQYNSEGAMRADMANMERDRLRLQAAMSEAQMREQIDSMDSASRSANLSNFYNNLGNIGTENAYMQMIENSPYLLYETYGKYKGGNSSKNGGYLTIKSKKRRR